MKLLDLLILCSFIISLYTSINAQECLVTFPPGEPVTIDSTYGAPEVLLHYQPTQVRTVYVVAWIINSSSCPGISQNDLTIAIQKLKSDFADAMISFECNQIETITDSTFCYLTDSLFQILTAFYDVENKLNIYFVPNGAAEGMAYYKTNNCAIINGSATHKGKLAHEVAHCFYLYHTHGYGIEELVNLYVRLTSKVSLTLVLLCSTD